MPRTAASPSAIARLPFEVERNVLPAMGTGDNVGKKIFLFTTVDKRWELLVIESVAEVYRGATPGERGCVTLG